MRRACTVPDKCIDLPVAGIEIALFHGSESVAYESGWLKSSLGGTPQGDVLESLVLAHAIAGVDVASPAYLEGLETAIDAVANDM